MNWLDDDKKDIFYAMKESDQELLVAEHKFNGLFWRVFDGDEKMIDKIRDLKQRVGTEDRVDIYDSLNEGAAKINDTYDYVVEPHKIDMDVYDIVFCNDHPHAGERAHYKRFDSYDDALNFIKRNAKYNNWDASTMNEDTVKTKDGKWTNKGDEGTHGKFKTKKEADAQRKAIFANGFKENLKESIYDWPVIIDDTRIQLPITENELIYFIETNLLNSKYNIDFIGEVKLITSGVDEANRKYYNIEVSGFLRQKNKMFKVPVRVWENGDIEDSRNPLPPVENVDESLKESYYKLCWYDSDPETGFYGDKFDCYAVVKAFDAKDAQEKFKDLLLRTGDEQDRDRIRYFKNFTDYLRDSQMYIDDATEDEYNEYKDYQDARFESLKEDFSNYDLINYNDFLANNFDGWSDDIDYLIKDLNKVAKALGTSAKKLIFYIDYDEEFWAADEIADVTLYLGQDYSIYKAKSSDVKFAALVPDNVWIFKDEKEANSIINYVKAFANDMDESFSRWGKFSEGLVDITDDFRFAREKWNELYPDVDFDLALERWNKESKIADPDWFAKPIYSVKAWEDMVQMFAPDIEGTSEESSNEIDED